MDNTIPTLVKNEPATAQRIAQDTLSDITQSNTNKNLAGPFRAKMAALGIKLDD